MAFSTEDKEEQDKVVDPVDQVLHVLFDPAFAYHAPYHL